MIRECGRANRFPRCPGGQEYRSHTGRLANAHGRHVGGDVLHGVVDSQPGRHRAARRVHIQVNILLGVFRFEKEELSRDHIGNRIVDLGAKKNDPVLQQAGINIIGPFTPTGLLDHVWYIVHNRRILIVCWCQLAFIEPAHSLVRT